MTYLTRDDFIRIACEAGIDKYLNTNGHLIGNLLERFGQKVVSVGKPWVGLTDDDVDYFVDAIYKGFDMKPRNEIEIEYFKRVIKFQPNSDDAMNNLGFLNMELGDYEQAIIYLNKAI